MKYWATSSAIVALFIATSATGQTAPAIANVQQLRDAIAKAERARDAAAAALQKADAAIAVLKAALPVDSVAASNTPQSATLLEGADKRGGKGESIPALKAELPVRPPDMPSCDSKSIAAYMLRMGDAPKQKKEFSWDSGEQSTNRGINAFVYHCLGLLRPSDYENTANLSAQFAETKGNEQIEATITRTARALKLINPVGANGPQFATVYNRYSIGGFGRTGSNGDAPLIDLTTSNFASGVGIVASFEWGRSQTKTQAQLSTSILAALAKARQECVTAKSIADPLTTDAVNTPQMTTDALAQCEGDALVQWMLDHGRANQYWQTIVAPLWGYSKTPPQFFAGAEGRYAFQDVKYRPVIDPLTGAVVTATLPPRIEIHPQPYSFKVYAGFNHELKVGDAFKATAGLTGSVTYRREIDFIDGTYGKTVCSPAIAGANFETCDSDQKLAAPYNTTGVVTGLQFNFQSQHFWYLPPIGIEPRLTYAFDTKRLGIEVPVFLMTDSEGKLNSGVKYTCRFRGETPQGYELKKTCNVSLFIGTSFDMLSKP